MKIISDYMKLSKQERQSHLDLSIPCEIRGANSQECRGLLAYFLDTTLPKGLKVVCCHACNNSSCSNPKHLYWGTSSENLLDAIACGSRNTKHSPEARKNIGKAMSKALIGKPKSESHKRAMSIAQIELRDRRITAITPGS